MKNHIILIHICWLFVACNTQLQAQSISDIPHDTSSDDVNLQGYILTSEESSFVFDPRAYGITPKKVVVTGSFRNWDQALDQPDWELKNVGPLWILELSETQKELITSNDQFKFRIDDGIWMDPPADAANISGGNLVFEPNDDAPSLRSEILDEKTIVAYIKGNRPLSPSAYQLKDHNGQMISISEVLPNDSQVTYLHLTKSIDPTRVYYLSIPSLNLHSWCSYDGWMRTMYSDKPLGAEVNGDSTSFRIFAPRASKVVLYLYDKREDTLENERFIMLKDNNGVWEYVIEKDLHGAYYDYTVHGPDEPGNMFYKTHPVHLTDPYARVSDNTWGKGRVWRATEPASPLQNGIPSMEDVIAYEVHIQDFTGQLPLDPALNGTFSGMITPGLKNKNGESIGFDYLINLGVNTVHLMPVQEYLHWPDEDWKASFKDDTYMIEQGVSEENYQWGYRTSHFFAVESKYRTKGAEPGSEREQFRNLVQAFHDNGMAVIIDIVPNHTAENMDGNGWIFNFNGIDKMYYYRTKDFEHIGAYGNEVKTENRPMVQRWLIDQCQYFIKEFGIDGFRIDLAGQIDEQTLIKLKDAIGHDKILYGEAWIGSNDPDYENNPDWDWYKEDSPITFFQDDTRNAFKGPVFELKDSVMDRGWPGGNYNLRDIVMKGLINHQPDDDTPLSGINYLDIHDNFALADQFGFGFDGRYEVDEESYKIATILLFTSLGPIVLHGGSEIMRSKAHAPLGEVEKTTNDGFTTYMHGYRDTYNHRTANEFIWEQVGQKPTTKNRNDYANMRDYWKGLIALRKSDIGKVFRKRESVDKKYYQWIAPTDNLSFLGYVVDNKVFVALNAGLESVTISKDSLPSGEWILIGDNNKVDHKNGINSSTLSSFESKTSQEIDIPTKGIGIWKKK